MRLIAVMNQKGGVGKTTCTLNLAHALALAGKQVLALDMDPQGHLAVGFGINETESALDDVMIDGAPLHGALIEARQGVQIAAAGPRLAEFEFVSGSGAERGWRLANAVKEAVNGYDYVLIDAPPSAGLLSMNVLMVAEEVLVPVSSDVLSLHGVARFMQILNHIDDSLGRKTQVWIAMTRFNDRRRLARDSRDKLLEYFPGQVLATPVRETAALAESPGTGKTIFEYQKNGKGAEDYRALAEDLINRRICDVQKIETQPNRI
jgi:chromosome partitioning protein